MSVEIALSGLRSYQAIINASSHNISNADTKGFKNVLVRTIAIPKENGVYSQKAYAISKVGSLDETSGFGDLAISGQGMFVVQNPLNNKRVFSRTGEFKAGKEGFLCNMQNYSLLGWKYDREGDLIKDGDISNLHKIQVDNLFMPAQATKNMDMQLRLKSDTPSLSNYSVNMLFPKADPLAKSNDILNINPAENQDRSFNVTIARPLGDTMENTTTKLVYGGFYKAENQLQSDDSKIATSGLPTDAISFKVDGEPIVTVKRSDFAKIDATDTTKTTDNKTALQNLQQLLSLRNIKTRIIEDSVNNKIQLILAPAEGESSMLVTPVEPANKLLEDLGFSSNSAIVEGAIENTKRFRSMRELGQLLKEDFATAETGSNEASSPQLILAARKNTSVAFSAPNSSNLLSELNILSNGRYAHMDSNYDPYVEEYNIRSGNIPADVVSTDHIYDSINTTHTINFGLNKISPQTWVMEGYIRETNEINDDKHNGVLQTSVLKFDNYGNISSIHGVESSCYSNSSIRNCFSALPCNEGDTLDITVPGNNTPIAFTFKANPNRAPNSREFNNLSDLVLQLNNDPQLESKLNAKIVSSPLKGYRLKLEAVANGSLTGLGLDGLVNSKLELDKVPKASDRIPDLNEKLNISWAGSTAEDSDIRFTTARIFNGANISSFEIKSDGHRAGNIVETEIDNNGDVIAKYDNSESEKIARIPIALANNIDGMQPGVDNTYELTSDAGAMLLHSSGEGRAGIVSPRHLEQSTVNVQNELPVIIRANQFYKVNNKAFQVENGLIETFVEGIRA